MYKSILLILFLGTIISQELWSIPEITKKGTINKSYIVSLTIRLGNEASISQSSEKAFNEAAQTVLRRENRMQIESSTILQSQENGRFFNKIISVEVEGEITNSKTFPRIIRTNDKGEIYIDYKFEFWINKNKKIKKDPYFNINASLTEIKEYYHGDKMNLNFESDSNCFMYMYNYLPYENKIKLIYKTEYNTNDGPLTIPGLTAEFSDSCNTQNRIFEHLIFVGMKQEKDILFGEKDPTYENFQKALKKLPRKKYETKMVSYVIHGK